MIVSNIPLFLAVDKLSLLQRQMPLVTCGHVLIQLLRDSAIAKRDSTLAVNGD